MILLSLTKNTCTCRVCVGHFGFLKPPVAHRYSVRILRLKTSRKALHGRDNSSKKNIWEQRRSLRFCMPRLRVLTPAALLHHLIPDIITPDPKGSFPSPARVQDSGRSVMFTYSS